MSRTYLILFLSIYPPFILSFCRFPRRSQRLQQQLFFDSNQTRIPYMIDEYCEIVDDFGVEAFEAFCESENGQDERLIRIEKSTCKELEGMNKAEIITKIEEVKANFENLGLEPAHLYPRRWEPVIDDASTDSMISVLQFNTLAEGLSAGPDCKPPFPVTHSCEAEKSIYGGFTDIPLPDVILDFDLRRWRLLEAILQMPDERFDLIALEEVDRYRGFFAPALRAFGYKGILAAKPRSPGVRTGWYSDGCCLFWKEDKFETIAEDKVEYNIGSQVALIVTLRHKPTSKIFVVAVTHLKAQKNAVNEKLRYHQVEQLLEEIGRAVTNARSASPVPVIILGDFNADPPADIAGDTSAVGKVLDVNGEREAGTRYSSAYDVTPAPESFFTTWKTRGTSTTKRIIDYIFYSNRVELIARLSVPKPEELESTKLPGIRWPSDHISIGAKLRFKD